MKVSEDQQSKRVFDRVGFHYQKILKTTEVKFQTIIKKCYSETNSNFQHPLYSTPEICVTKPLRQPQNSPSFAQLSPQRPPPKAIKHKTCNLRELLCPELSEKVPFPANLHLVFLTVTVAKVKEIQLSPPSKSLEKCQGRNFSRVNKLNFVYNFSPVFFLSFCPLIR
jgi:hypothetical protein